jgi:hypothetical protein
MKLPISVFVFFGTFAGSCFAQDAPDHDKLVIILEQMQSEPSSIGDVYSKWATAHEIVSPDLAKSIMDSASKTVASLDTDGVKMDNSWGALADEGNARAQDVFVYSSQMSIEGVDPNEIAALALILEAYSQQQPPPGADKFCLPPIIWFCSVRN